MAAPAGPRIEEIIDLRNPEAFDMQKLTPEQAVERFKILRAQKGALPAGGKLSPRSLREFATLADLVTAGPGARASVQVVRDAMRNAEGREIPIEFYTVQYRQTPEERALTQFNAVGPMITAMKRSGVTTDRGLLTMLVEPGEGMEWYQLTTMAQMGVVMGGDFNDSLMYSHLANLHLLKASLCLSTLPEVYPQIVSLHQNASTMFLGQRAYNRRMQDALLDHSAVTLEALDHVRDTAEGHIGRADPMPEDVSGAIVADIGAVRGSARNMFEIVERSSQEFLDGLTALEQRVTETETAIFTRSGAIGEFVTEKGNIEARKAELVRLVAEKGAERVAALNPLRDEINALLEDHRERLALEAEGKTVTTVKGSNWNIAGIFTHTGKDEVVVTEADFGSAEVYARYQTAKRIFNERDREFAKAIQGLESQLGNLEKELAALYVKNLNRINPEADLKQAAASLAATSFAIGSLKTSIEKRRNLAEAQRRQIDRITRERPALEGTRGVVAFLENGKSDIVQAHAAWVQSHRQVFAIDGVERRAERLKELVMGDIQAQRNFTGEALPQITAEVALMTQPEGAAGEGWIPPFEELFPTAQALLGNIERRAPQE